MNPDRNESFTVSAGTNPNVTPGHLSDEHPFDKTSLPEAIEQGHVDTTLDTGQLEAVHSEPERPPVQELPIEQAETKGGNHKTAKIAASIGALLLAGGVALGINANNSSDKQADSVPQPNPNTISAPANPGQTQETAPATNPNTQPTDEEKLTKSLEIKSGQTPENLAKNYLAVVNKWINAGCDEATLQESYKQTSITLQEFSTNKATELATPYIVALFGPDYKTNPRAMSYLDAAIKLNAGVIESYIRSDPTYNKEVKAHYKQTENFDTIVSSSQNGDQTTLIFDGHLENNSKDAPGALTAVQSGQKVSYTVQFKTTDGVEHLIDSSATDK